MKPSWSIVTCFVLFTFIASAATADDEQKPASDSSVWVTSISQIGSSDQFAAATANGLLLRESTVNEFNASDPTKLTPLYTHPAAVWCVVSTDDGGTVASVDYRGNLVVFDTKGKKAKTHEKAFERWCQAMTVSTDNKHVIAGNEAGKVFAWDLEAGKAVKSVEVDGTAITGLSVSPDGKHVAASDGGGHIHLLKWPSLEAAGKIEVCKENLWCVTYSADGKHLIAGSSDRNLYRCEAKADAKAENVAKGTDWITQIAVSKGGHIAAAEVGGRLHFPSSGGTDSMDAKSGIWALCWNGDEQLFAGTRKNGIVIAGRSWKWAEPKKPEPEKKPEDEKPAAEEKPSDEKEMKEEPKKESKPAEKKPEAKKDEKEEKKADVKAKAKSEEKPKADQKAKAKAEPAKKADPKKDDTKKPEKKAEAK